jgi:hypothetical protein
MADPNAKRAIADCPTMASVAWCTVRWPPALLSNDGRDARPVADRLWLRCCRGHREEETFEPLPIDRTVNSIDCMVNNRLVSTSDVGPGSGLGPATRLVWLYVGVVCATIVVLAVLSGLDPGQATPEAWVHAGIVGVFAVLLLVRMRAARQGSRRAIIAAGIIATVLVVVNLVEALIPGLFPIWMRVEMVGIAALMATLAALVRRERR